MNAAGNGTSFNADELNKFLESLVRNRMTMKAGLKSLAEFWQRQGADLDLETVLAFPLIREMEKLEAWFGTLWRPKGPPVTSDGLWFGITESARGGVDVYAAVLPRHGREPQEWDWSHVRYAKPKLASSRLFKTLLSPAGPVRSPTVRHYLGIGLAVLAAHYLCHALRPTLGAREPVVAAGYDGGDHFILGKARVNGHLELLPREFPVRPRELLPRGNLFRLTDFNSTTAWILDKPRDKNGRELKASFTQQAKPIAEGEAYEIPVYLKGRRQDFSFTLSHVPVVRRSVAELIVQADRAAVQRLPVTIDGVRNEYEILNVLFSISPVKLLAQSQKAKVPLSELDLGKHHLVRAKTMLLVTRDLAEELVKAGVSGIGFAPLKAVDLE